MVTGYIFHLQQQYVHPVTVPVENALKSVISCGVGSKPLLDAFHQIPEGKRNQLKSACLKKKSSPRSF